MNSENNNNSTPRLRFPGFTEEWEGKRLDDCFILLRNNTLSRSQLNDMTGNVKNIHYGDVLVKYGEILDVEKEHIPFITDEVTAEQACRETLKNGDVIIADTAEDNTVGKCTEIINIGENPVVSGLHTIPLRPSRIFAPGYLGYYMNSQTYRVGLYPLMQGVKVTSISRSAIVGTNIHFPSSLAEQEKIAGCLSEVDAVIEAQVQKVEALKERKRGLMQQLFPQSGETTPRLRFPGFEGEWEEKKLSDFFDRITEKNVENNKNVLTISAQYGLISQLDFFKKSVAALDVTGYYLLHKGDFAYNKSRSHGKPVGAIKPLKLYDKGVVSTLYICFRCKNGNDVGFWEQYFDAGLFDKEIKAIAQEGARIHGLLNVPINDFFGLTVLTTKPAEQEKIAKCLSAIDCLITEEAAKLDALKAHKRGLMQQLFPQPSK